MATVGAVEVGRGAGRGSRGGGVDRGRENTTKERAWKDKHNASRTNHNQKREGPGTTRKWRVALRLTLFTYTSRLLNLILPRISLTSRIKSPARAPTIPPDDEKE